MILNRVLVVVAHPDDEVLGCGGLIDKLIKNKKKVKVIFLAEGSSCRFSDKNNKSKLENAIRSRKIFAKNAMSSLKVKEYVFYNLRCGALNTYSLIYINQIIEKEIKIFKPDTIITHHSDDCNVDHNIIYKSVLISSRPVPNSTIKNVICFEVLSSTEWNFDEKFKPNFFVDIEDNIKSKIMAFKEYYSSEGKNFPFPRSLKGIKVLANYRGMQIGVKNAEAFRIIRSLEH